MKKINFIALALTFAGSLGHIYASGNPPYLFMSTPALFLMFALGWVGVFFVPALFAANLVLWFRPKSNIYTIIGAIALVVLTLLNGVASVGDGLRWYGAFWTVACSVVSLAIIGGAWQLSVRAMREPSPENIAMLRGFLYVTLNWGAMPYLGELP